MFRVSKLLLATLGFVGLTVGGAVQAEAANLVSYRALYDVHLANATRGASVSGAGGKLAYGVKKTCDAWVSNQSANMFLQTNSGDVLGQATTYSSWESLDGTLFRFTGGEEGNEASTILGGASMPAKSGDGEATYSSPEAATFRLPAGTLFPVKHTQHILRLAKAGSTQFQNLVFEGVEVEGAKLLVTFVSAMTQQAKEIAAKNEVAEMKRPGWNFRLAYFDLESRAGEPLYEVEVDYLDNGIPVRWMMDYGEYSIEMDLSKIEILPPPHC